MNVTPDPVSAFSLQLPAPLHPGTLLQKGFLENWPSALLGSCVDPRCKVAGESG